MLINYLTQVTYAWFLSATYLEVNLWFSLLHFFTEELTAWIQHVYRKYALDDAKERFSEFDTDKDGVVSWEEYNTVSHGQLITFDDPASDDPEKESLRYVRLAFKKNSITTFFFN